MQERHGTKDVSLVIYATNVWTLPIYANEKAKFFAKLVMARILDLKG